MCATAQRADSPRTSWVPRSARTVPGGLGLESTTRQSTCSADGPSDLNRTGPRASYRARSMRRPLVLLTLGMLITACGGSDDAGPAEPVALAEDPGIVHVHGLGRNPTDGALFIATHTGLFRLADGGSPQRVAGNDQDTMGFSVVGPD